MPENTSSAGTDKHPKRLGKVVHGLPHRVGDGFIARHFSEEMFSGRMDPLLMVDHFVMTAPTFEPHLHAGISAVTVMFEDAEGAFVNRDTLGQNLALRAGDLYWLAAAQGAVHEERPEAGARIHALQIFVNLPGRLKKEPARAFHVPAQRMPALQGPGHRVRVVLGRSGTAVGAQGAPQEMTMLDGSLVANGHFTHTLPEGQQAWLYVVSGTLAVRCQNQERRVEAGGATTVSAGADAGIMLQAVGAAHFVLVAGEPIRERFVKHGPLVMSSSQDVRQTLSQYAEGRFGHITP
jgi:redox-sensitive bicupin YhaK (pirin superfamily)